MVSVVEGMEANLVDVEVVGVMMEERDCNNKFEKDDNRCHI